MKSFYFGILQLSIVFVFIMVARSNEEVNFSSPLECSRTCLENEPPKTCYYKFILEYFTTVGAACQFCYPNSTNTLSSTCQCVLADGVERTVLSANRMLPGPSIEVCKGDKVVIDVDNRLGGMDITIHWHGIFQEGSQYYDGMPYVTQCPILENAQFRYQWIAGNEGTHFWHSHTGFQKLDGITGSLIVREPQSKDPNGYLYDEDLRSHKIFLTDWLHQHWVESFPGRLFSKRGQLPENILINGKGQFTNRVTGHTTDTPLEEFNVAHGRRYRFRMINAYCTTCPALLTIQNHSLTVIAIDGVPVQPVVVDAIISMTGERYDFIVNADQTTGTYWIQVRDVGQCTAEKIQQVAILRYDNILNEPSIPRPTFTPGLPVNKVLNTIERTCDKVRDDAICIDQLKSYDSAKNKRVLDHPDIQLYLPFGFHIYNTKHLFQPNTYNHFIITPSGRHLESHVDGISFTFPPSALISQFDEMSSNVFCNHSHKLEECTGEFCTCTHLINVPLNATVELIIFDISPSRNLVHPFHLHGYTFSVLGTGSFPNRILTTDYIREMDKRGFLHRNLHLPPVKDTITIPSSGYSIIRFKADNPGFWFFHCHILFHVDMGMAVVFKVGKKEDLPPIPHNFPRCGNFVPPLETRCKD